MSHQGYVPSGLHAAPPIAPIDAREAERSYRMFVATMRLVQLRQARELAGLDNSRIDVEITLRIIEAPAGWGWLGEYLSYIARRSIRET